MNSETFKTMTRREHWIFAQIVLKRMHSARISRKQMAEILGRSYPTVCGFLSPSGTASKYLAEELANYFDIKEEDWRGKNG